jgi:L-aminopeptidase/D-esterase-like protein
MPPPPLTLRDVPGLEVGHATDEVGITGCTVVLAREGAAAGVDVRGAAPGTRETDLLRPTALVDRIHAICLSGGSAFGLAAADGVMRWLAEGSIGFPTGVRPVPIVPAAILFDLAIGSADAVPGPDDGYAACAAAAEGTDPLEGSVGAGTGATVAKLGGVDGQLKGGVGSAGRRLPEPDGSIVAALAVSNALGSIVGRDGRVIAGTRAGPGRLPPGFGNSTLAVIGTDASLDRAQCRRLAELGHDALARSVRPVHTMFDGDVVFALATGQGGGPPSAAAFTELAIAAEDALSEAIERSVLLATPRGGVPAART